MGFGILVVTPYAKSPSYKPYESVVKALSRKWRIPESFFSGHPSVTLRPFKPVRLEERPISEVLEIFAEKLEISDWDLLLTPGEHGIQYIQKEFWKVLLKRAFEKRFEQIISPISEDSEEVYAKVLNGLHHLAWRMDMLFLFDWMHPRIIDFFELYGILEKAEKAPLAFTSAYKGSFYPS